MKTNKTAKPDNNRKAWSEDDDRLLQDLIRRHTPKAQIAQVLGRTAHALEQQISAFHRELWATSGHPEAKPKQLQPATRATLQESLDRIEAKLDQLLAALGEDKPQPEQRPNGRAHA